MTRTRAYHQTFFYKIQCFCWRHEVDTAHLQVSFQTETGQLLPVPMLCPSKDADAFHHKFWVTEHFGLAVSVEILISQYGPQEVSAKSG